MVKMEEEKQIFCELELPKKPLQKN